MKTYITSATLSKQLCLHCKHLVEDHSYMDVRRLCGLERSKVDDSPKHSAELARDLDKICGGKYWEQSPDVVVCDDPEKTRFEDGVAECMEIARRHVRDGTRPWLTFGYMQEAIKRAEEES